MAVNDAAGGAGPDAGSKEIPIVAAPGANLPYQFGMNPYGIQGTAFFAQSAMGTSSVVLDETQPSKLCLSGTVEGATIPPIRFKTTPTGKDPAQEQDSCALVAPMSGVQNQILFTNMYVQCWDGPQGTGMTDTSHGLLDVGLQVAATTDAAIPLDFCLTGFGVIGG